MSRFWREIVDLVLPAECAGCGRTRVGSWCERCRTRSGGPAAVRRVWPDPIPPGLPAVYAAGAYEDELRAALLAHKERGALRLARPLGEALADAVGGAWAGAAGATGAAWAGVTGSPAGAGVPLLLVPVPSARRATAARGHDPARRIAARAAGELRRTGFAARVVPVLRQRRAVADQAGLSAAERLANLAGALGAISGAGRLLAAGPVAVVDDLMTTGASLAEAARAVAEAGGHVLAAAVVAASPRSYDSLLTAPERHSGLRGCPAGDGRAQGGAGGLPEAGPQDVAGRHRRRWDRDTRIRTEVGPGRGCR